MEKMLVAKKKTLLEHPFFASDLYRGKGVVPRKDIPTLRTDGESIWFNEDFVENKIQVWETIFGLCHEILHIRFCDNIWMRGKVPILANAAADYVINMVLSDFGIKRPEWVLYDEKYRNMSKTEIYHVLLEQMPKDGNGQGDSDDNDGQPGNDPGNGQGNGHGKPGNSQNKDNPGNQGQGQGQDGKWNIGEIIPYNGPKSDKELEAEAKQRILEGVRAMKQKMGSLPGFLKKLLKDYVEEPPLSWDEMLTPLLRSIMEGEPTWENVDRRYLAHDIFLPGEKGTTGKAIVVIDSSGSTYDQVERFIGQIRHILNQVDLKMDLVQQDTEVQEIVEDFVPCDDFELKGGGGTDFRPVFEMIENGELEGDVVLFFTDMYGRYPEDEPHIPVIWIDYDGGYARNRVPFGHIIEAVKI
jgi:predicted metal-dependent peptidase